MATYPISEIEKKAWEYAKEKHAGVFRKFLNKSYFDAHIAKVFEILKKFNRSPILGAAAILHDTIEDTDVEQEDIKNLFGKEVADIVQELTSDESEIEKVGKTEYLKVKLVHLSNDALLIKLCDRFCNVSDHYAQSPKFRTKYYKETREVIEYLMKNRRLNKSQKTLSEQIYHLVLNMKSRYKMESKKQLKYLMLFESFKIKNISIEDIIRCIDRRGSIYTNIIKDYPNNNSKVSIKPLNIDEDGLITVEIEGKNYEVELKNVTEIKW